jgi:hypothetical protein
MKKKDSALVKHPSEHWHSSREIGARCAVSPDALALVPFAKQLSFPLSLAARQGIARTRTHDGVWLLFPLPRSFFFGVTDQTNMSQGDRRALRFVMLTRRVGRA